MSISAAKVGISALLVLAVALAATSQWASFFVFVLISLGAIVLGLFVTLIWNLFLNMNTKPIPVRNMNLSFCDDAVQEFIRVSNKHLYLPQVAILCCN
jgi:hypothetical protein